jgi:dTMP kinase
LDAGQVVLTDRYYLSTVAYQGARGFDPQRLLRDAEAEFPNPDLALLFWVAPAIGLKRARDRGGVGEAAFEEAGVLSAVAEVFSALETPYLVRVDAAGDPDRVHQRVLEIVAERLPALGGPRQR